MECGCTIMAKGRFYEGRSVEDGEVILFKLRDLSLFRALACKSYHSSSIIGGQAFSRFFFPRANSYVICIICKNGGTRVNSVPRIIFLTIRAVAQARFRETVIIWQIVLTCCRKKETYFKHFSIFSFPSLILETKECSQQPVSIF